jgi:PAS domain S-box-containing protein
MKKSAMRTEVAEEPFYAGVRRRMAYWNQEFPRIHSPILRYGFSVVSVVIAFGVALALQHYQLHDGELPVFTVAIALTSWYAGNGPSVLAVLLSAACFDYFFTEPRYSFYISASDLPYYFIFVVWAAIVASFSAVRRRIEDNLRQARDNLQVEVEQRRHREDEIRKLNQELSKRAEEALRRSETFLAEGQRISHTGSWGWNIATGKLVWSEEHCRIFGFDPNVADPTFQLFSERLHPEDRSLVQKTLDEAIRERSGFSLEFRIVLPDGSIKHLHGLGHPVLTAAGDLDDYIGTTMDITERKRGEDALRTAQADLTRVARLTTMGELAASIAHEINQPLGAIVANGNACLRWLAKDQPQLDDARRAAERIVKDGHRAGEILKSVRALAGASAPDMMELDINDAIREVLTLTGRELHEYEIVLKTELSDGLPPIMGDRVQLEQVILNLVMNAIEAMSAEPGEPRRLRVRSQGAGPGAVLIAIEDSGPGIAPETMDRLFDAFFTTKPNGLGMGLSICRSIINAHGGRLWVSPSSPRGAVFQFTVPIAAKGGALSAHDAARHSGGRSAQTASSPEQTSEQLPPHLNERPHSRDGLAP